MRLALAALLLVSTAALALPPPPAKPAAPKEVISEDQLFAQLKKAESAEEAHPIEEKLNNWFRASGSASVDLLMSRVQAEQAAADAKTAKKLIEAVTRIAPNYAEGWHVKAAMEAADNDDANAMISLQKTVALNPRNFSAMVELGEMLEDYGDKKSALGLYRRALDLDPQMDEAKRKVRELSVSVEGRDI